MDRDSEKAVPVASYPPPWRPRARPSRFAPLWLSSAGTGAGAGADVDPDAEPLMSEAGDEEDADADPDPEAGDGSLPRSRSRSSRSTSRSRPTSSRPCSFLLALLACLLSFSLGWLSSGTSSSAPLSRAGAGTWLDEQVGQKEFPSPYKEDDPALQFPGDETRDVIPKMVHSHNDYWRKVPVYTAFQHGALSIEADVWKLDDTDTLYVGHTRTSLTSSRTFESLYVSQLVRLLERSNPSTNSSTPSTRSLSSSPSNISTPASNWNGIFSSNTSAPIYLFIDIKTSGARTWSSVIRGLEPLRSRGWLTTWNGTHLLPGPVTIIGTGNVPASNIAPLSQRDYFVDAPAWALDRPLRGSDGRSYEWNATLAPVASGDWATHVGYWGIFPPRNATRERVKRWADEAHRRGITVRWWGNTGWPTYARDRVWMTMLEAGVDWLNADDLDGVSRL